MHAIEVILERVAVELKMDPAAVREANFYTHKLALTPYKLPMFGVHIQEVWHKLKETVQYDQRLKAVQEFNRTHLYHKRGISMTPVKYNMTYKGPENHHAVSSRQREPSSLSQGTDAFAAFCLPQCLLNVHKEDGSILVHHSGAELGQGINTKVHQTVVHRINSFLKDAGVQYRITMDEVAIGETNSTQLANASLTGGSSGSETCCLIAATAADMLTDRLKDVVKKAENDSWAKAIEAAYDAGISLQVSADHNTHPEKIPFQYQVWTAACTQVEIDVLTGSQQIQSVDICYDVGSSLNPIVDIGQLEGGFVMGLGVRYQTFCSIVSQDCVAHFTHVCSFCSI